MEANNRGQHESQHGEPRRNTSHTKNNVQQENIYTFYDSSVRKRDDQSGRLSSLATTSGVKGSRPGSATKRVQFKERPTSSFSFPGKSPRPSSSKNSSLHKQNTPAGDDDEEVNVEALSELLGTVRQYAQEIHEIYAPIKKDEEERIRKKKERKARSKSKDLGNDPSVKTGKLPINQEVKVEIHKTADQRMLEEGRNFAHHKALAHSRSYEPPRTNNVASLHVEEEDLSSSWPRGSQRSRSREKLSPDVTRSKQKLYPSLARFQNSSGWGETNSVQHEKEILNKAFQRIQNPRDDPLISSVNKTRPRSEIHEQMKDSRQSVIEVARQHKQARQQALPSISVISPSTQYINKSWNSPRGVLPSAPPEYVDPYLPIKPSAPPLEEDSYNGNFPNIQRAFPGGDFPGSVDGLSDSKSGPRNGFRVKNVSEKPEYGEDRVSLEKY